MGHRGVGDEKLAAVRARTRISHAQQTRLVEFQIGRNLIIKNIPRTTHSSPTGITCLGHEPRNYAVKSDIVVPTILGQKDKAVYSQGRFLCVKLNRDISLLGLNCSNIFLGLVNGHRRAVFVLLFFHEGRLYQYCQARRI